MRAHDATDWRQLLAELRTAFDAAFAEGHAAEATGRPDGLAVGVGTRAYALRLAEIAAIDRIGTVTPVPGAAAAALGLAIYRDRPVPVFDLAAAVDREAARTERAQWLVLHPFGNELWGFACDSVLGLTILSDTDAGVRIGGRLAQLVDLAACCARLDCQDMETSR